MKRIGTKEHKSQILAMLARLRDDMGRMAGVGAQTSGIAANREATRMPIHPADIAGEDFDRQCEFSLMESKEETVRQLEDALDRIEQGIYGICQECGGRICKARLAAVPHAVRCIKCASQLERG